MIEGWALVTLQTVMHLSQAVLASNHPTQCQDRNEDARAHLLLVRGCEVQG